MEEVGNESEWLSCAFTFCNILKTKLIRKMIFYSAILAFQHVVLNAMLVYPNRSPTYAICIGIV